jgi:hypothetical protein
MRESRLERGQVTDTEFAKFRGKIAALPAEPSYDKQSLLVDDFLLGTDDKTKVYYAPFDHVNTSALLANAEMLKRVKRVAAFSGVMRTNLLSMFDSLGLPRALGVGGTAELFEPGGEGLLHSTSALRYPVFIDGKNYSGYPAAASMPLLHGYFDLLASELASLDGALIVPLGKAVKRILDHLIAANHLNPSRTLMGFPHPCGANAGRPRLFAENREQMTDVVERWFA